MGRYEGDPFFEPVEPLNRDAAFSSGQSLRPGIVHRLDRDTSGVMIVARTPRTRDFLIQRFAHREVGKRYYAIVKGVPSQRAGVVDAAIGRDPRHRVRFSIHLDTDSHQGSAAKPAVTGYRTLAAYSSGRYALIELRPQTGRTHQLRVHMAGLGHPILGDPLYARKDALRAPRLMLHAYELALRPCPVCAPRQFRATFPRDFQVVLSSLSSLDR
jgi:23S rRNA pseudouridine1911/1915/1917 synthase